MQPHRPRSETCPFVAPPEPRSHSAARSTPSRWPFSPELFHGPALRTVNPVARICLAEAGHIAGNLALGHGYAIAAQDGRFLPTAWISPLYPLLLSGIFRVFGAFSKTSASVAL